MSALNELCMPSSNEFGIPSSNEFGMPSSNESSPNSPHKMCNKCKQDTQCKTDIICVFCIEEIRCNGGDKVRLRCKHEFHRDCIVDYIKHTIDHMYRTVYLKCPTCRKHITRKGLFSILLSYFYTLRDNYKQEVRELGRLRKKILFANIRFQCKRLFKKMSEMERETFTEYEENLLYFIQNSYMKSIRIKERMEEIESLYYKMCLVYNV